MLTIDQHLLNKAFCASTSALRMTPDFIIIGAMRGGTTSLYSYMTAHPGVGPAHTKEVHFFDVHHKKGFSWYQAQFPLLVQKYYTEFLQKRRFITGEASPYYLFHPHAPKRIVKRLPHVKLIVLLRDPVTRAYSHYHHEVSSGFETLSFAEAIECEEERIGKEAEKLAQDEQHVSFQHRHFSYLARGIYVDQLQHWMRYFPREQFLILNSEDFYADPASGLKQALEFVNLPTIGLKVQKEEYEQLNATKPPKMAEEVRRRLKDYFEPHNARLAEFLGRDFSWNR